MCIGVGVGALSAPGARWGCWWVLAATLLATSALAQPAASLRYRAQLTREAHFVHGLDAPVPMFAAQIEQESGWRPGVTAWDNGRGLAQFMDATSATIVQLYPELGTPQPYDAAWAMRALVRYDAWLYRRVKGDTECDRWAAALKSYNAGLGYVQQAQRASSAPGVWFGVTEYAPTRQSAKNFEYSRMYPRWILLKRQAKYAHWGAVQCEGVKP